MRSEIQWTVNKHEQEVRALDYSKVFGQNGKLRSQNPLSPKLSSIPFPLTASLLLFLLPRLLVGQVTVGIGIVILVKWIRHKSPLGKFTLRNHADKVSSYTTRRPQQHVFLCPLTVPFMAGEKLNSL
jgi:hypothetical protein